MIYVNLAVGKGLYNLLTPLNCSKIRDSITAVFSHLRNRIEKFLHIFSHETLKRNW